MTGAAADPEGERVDAQVSARSRSFAVARSRYDPLDPFVRGQPRDLTRDSRIRQRQVEARRCRQALTDGPRADVSDGIGRRRRHHW